MWLVFLDESGYTPGDWKAGIAQQPFYVVSAVFLPADKLPDVYAGIRKRVAELKVLNKPELLGLGTEIKAKEIAAGGGWWAAHNDERNAVRDTMLTAPRDCGGCAVVAVIDKAAHAAKYSDPDDAYMLGFRFVVERIANFLEGKKSHAYCVYDLNARLQNPLLAQTSALIANGSYIAGYSGFYEQEYEFNLKVGNVSELGFGNSKHSLGLQIADYFATFAYQYFKDGRPQPCGWWDTLQGSLRREKGTVNGYGLKVFP